MASKQGERTSRGPSLNSTPLRRRLGSGDDRQGCGVGQGVYVALQVVLYTLCRLVRVMHRLISFLVHESIRKRGLSHGGGKRAHRQACVVRLKLQWITSGAGYVRSTRELGFCERRCMGLSCGQSIGREPIRQGAHTQYCTPAFLCCSTRCSAMKRPRYNGCILYVVSLLCFSGRKDEQRRPTEPSGSDFGHHALPTTNYDHTLRS